MTHKDKIILELVKRYTSDKDEIKVLDVGAGDKPLHGKLPKG